MKDFYEKEIYRMKALKCDVCGEYYSPYIIQVVKNGKDIGDINSLKIFRNNYMVNKDLCFDLCPACAKNIVNAINQLSKNTYEVEDMGVEDD